MGEKNSIRKHSHDAFFKGTFSKRKIAIDFLTNYLPEDIKKHVDLQSLKNQNGEYVDKNLKKDYSDLLYQVEINGHEGYIYFLFEHKSYEDQKVIFQLLRYMTRIWEERYDSKTKKVPVVIPIVIYHGRKEWKIETRLWKYLLDIETMPESIQKMSPDFEYKSFDYSPESKLEIKGSVILQAVLKILKAIREKDKKNLIDGFMEFVLLVDSEEDIQLGNDIFDLGLEYLMSIEAEITKEDLIQASKERGDVVKSLAQRLRNEGREEGMEIALINLYKNGFTVDQIVAGLEISKEKALEIIEKAKKNIN